MAFIKCKCNSREFLCAPQRIHAVDLAVYGVESSANITVAPERKSPSYRDTILQRASLVSGI